MKPIIFNTEMVKAIMEGRKTQTRRPIKPQPSGNGKLTTSETGFPRVVDDIRGMMWTLSKSPYQVGDILYVQETWAILQCQYFYRADMENPTCHYKTRWLPSIHMPKEAARIFLRVTDVRVERLQDITEEAVRKEGFRDEFVMDVFYPCGHFFSKTWNKIYSKRGYGWTSNPWVWAIKFERISTQEGSPS